VTETTDRPLVRPRWEAGERQRREPAQRCTDAAARRQLAIREPYRSLAGTYDVRSRVARLERRRVVGMLQRRPGDTVLDVGCGTGLCFAEIVKTSGPPDTCWAQTRAPTCSPARRSASRNTAGTMSI
jgi:2-polyprenyl-3-methyl-5-hydroxy-6-metoxy-1,4-benzoquinol methylase